MPIESRPHARRVAEYCTIGEAAEYLSLTDRSVRRYIAGGRIPAYRGGERQIRLKISDVDALLVPVAAGVAS